VFLIPVPLSPAIRHASFRSIDDRLIGMTLKSAGRFPKEFETMGLYRAGTIPAS